MWIYESPIGVFKIKYVCPGRYELWLDDELITPYRSYVAAADDVFCFATGLWEWNKLFNDVMPPNDISEWVYVRR